MERLAVALVAAASISAGGAPAPTWKYLSSKNGDLEAPFPRGKQQTSSVVFDVDKDGRNDFVLTERTAAPSVVWYRRTPTGWQRHVLDQEPLTIEAGSTAADIDGDGDLDLVAGGDHRSNQVWWWENPHPRHAPDVPWVRHVIKSGGAPKHHDQMFGDFDGDGKLELVFWNQEGHKLYWSPIPPSPRTAREWPVSVIYEYSGDSQPAQRGTYPGWKQVNEHEGLAQADVDGDGKTDIVGGGQWLKHVSGNHFVANPIDPGYAFTRSAVGQLKEGGRPEVVLSVGDGNGPLMWYEWDKGTWIGHELLHEIRDGHSLSIVDLDRDGHLDVFCGEMRIDGRNPDARMYVFFGDGKGNFRQAVAASGHDSHEAKLADLDGDGDLDILGKPYNFGVPLVEIWLNQTRK